MLENWSEAERYEPFMGRWSRLVAEQFLTWLNPEPQLDWLDVGCETGALTHGIQEQQSPRLVVSVDRSFGYTLAVKRTTQDGRACVVTDAEALAIHACRFDEVVSGLVLNFVPDPNRAIGEMVRVVRPGGRVALYVWDYGERMEMLRHFWDAAAELQSEARQLDEGLRFPVCQPGALEDLFQRNGLQEVQSGSIEVATMFRNFDDYWAPFFGGQGPAPGYLRSLTDAEQVALREQIEKQLPRRADQSISLKARAWAIQGRAADNLAA